MLARIKQGLTFIFGKYKSEWNIEVKKILTDKEKGALPYVLQFAVT